MTIETVLFDADGVLQRPAVGWRDALGAVLGDSGASIDGFLADLFAAEEPALVGEGDFLPALEAVLRKWSCPGGTEGILTIWTEFAVSEENLEVVARLRRGGMRCCLATNQQAIRAKAMSGNLGYRDRFDREFYSCDLGAAKPDPAFFERLLADLAAPPESVFFLDDSEENVRSARTLGIRAEVFTMEEGADRLVTLLDAHGLEVGG